MGNFPRQLARLTHIFLFILFGLSDSVHFRSSQVLADEQEVSHDTSSTVEIELSVRGKLKFPAGRDLRSDSLEIIEQPVHAHSNLSYRQNACFEGSGQNSTVIRRYDHAVAKAVIGEDCVNTQLPGNEGNVHVCRDDKGLNFWFREGFLRVLKGV